MKLVRYENHYEEITRALPSALQAIVDDERFLTETEFPIGSPFNMIAERTWGWMRLQPGSKKSYRVIRLSLWRSERQHRIAGAEPEFYLIFKVEWSGKPLEFEAFVRSDFLAAEPTIRNAILKARLLTQ